MTRPLRRALIRELTDAVNNWARERRQRDVVDGLEVCRQCPGDKAARVEWKRYLSNGGTLDLRSWARNHVRLPDELAWTELRSWCKSRDWL